MVLISPGVVSSVSGSQIGHWRLVAFEMNSTDVNVYRYSDQLIRRQDLMRAKHNKFFNSKFGCDHSAFNLT
jgi:hypothetical protein